MFEPVTKWNTRVERVDAIPEIVRKAFKVAMLEKPGPDPHRAARERRGDAAATPATPSGRSCPRHTYFPEPTDEAIAHAARLLASSERPIVLAGNGVLRRGASDGAARARPRPARAGCRDVHGQGRDRRPLAPVADGRRAPGARPRPVGLRPRRPRGVRRLRHRRVRRRRCGTRGGTTGSSTSTRSRPRSTRPTGRRSS